MDDVREIIGGTYFSIYTITGRFYKLRVYFTYWGGIW